MRGCQYLATAAALLAGPLAGCAHPSVVLLMDEVDDAALADRANRTVDRDPENRRILAGAVVNGSSSATGRSRTGAGTTNSRRPRRASASGRSTV
jgi:hypothetical protein